LTGGDLSPCQITFDDRLITYLPNFSHPNLEGSRPGYAEAQNLEVREIREDYFQSSGNSRRMILNSAKFGTANFQVRDIRGAQI
jgi:hypothetical protein